MAEFAEYYVKLLSDFFKNVWTFISQFAYVFYKAIVLDTISYFKLLGTNAGDFNVLSWIMFVLVLAINGCFIFFLLYRIFQLIRRYIIFRGKEVEKDKLMEEIAKLRMETEKVVQEKNKILALKLGSNLQEAVSMQSQDLLQTSSQNAVGGALPSDSQDITRFTKLTIIDKKYENQPNYIFMKDEDMLSLNEIVEKFRLFAASQLKLYYNPETIRQFIAGLATSKIIILEGISGTGKTSLPYAFAKFFNNEAMIVSVQPSWRDRGELIGYYNDFTKKFSETDFLCGIYESTLREDPNFIVLDEMNLARIEYYFADFLSIMEMPDVAEWKCDIVSESLPSDPKNLVYGKILIPQNLWFIGTANNDDSTFTITDKVYDRAVALTLNNKADYFDAPIEKAYNCSYQYLNGLFKKAINENPVSDDILSAIKEMDNFIQQKFKIAFGNRILKQIKLFVPVYVECGGTEIGGLDFMVATKILRKFNSLNLPFLTKELQELQLFFNKKFGKGQFKCSIEYINELLKLN